MGSIGREYPDDRVCDLLGLSDLQGKPQWVWFAVLAVLAEIGGVVMLAAVQAQRLTY
jgi:hypothetical protein